MQYTLRNVPKHLDRALRERARRENKSLNEVALEGLLRGFALLGEPPPQRDLTGIAGTWQDDREMNKVLRQQRRIDRELWP